MSRADFSAAAGALLVALLNELRASLRARQANRDRSDLAALARAEQHRSSLAGAGCDAGKGSPGGPSGGGCGCDGR
jgi:hypothetical protein